MKEKRKNFWQRLGPGFITGAADDDPSGIATYSQTGAQFGYTQLWTALFSFPLMLVVQEMCGRIGTVTGQGLSGVIRKHYSKKILAIAVLLLFVANTINVGADLGAMAATTQALFGLPFVFWLFLITVGTLLLQIFVPYPAYAKFLKFLTLSLLAYVATALIVKQDWALIGWSTIVPAFSWDKQYILNVVAILGTTISPYLFFWQADEEVEEEIAHNKIAGFGIGKPILSKKDFKDLWIDTSIGMLFSNLMMFFIVVTAASTLGANGITSIETATQAAQALRPIAGPFASLLFLVGIMGVGLLAVPILAGSASYAVAEAFGWKIGLSQKWRQAPAFYGVIILATVIGLFVNFLSIPPFKVLYYTAVLNGLVAPILLVLILLISNNKKIMGKHTNGKVVNILGIIATIVMFAAGISLFILQ
jgi:NRAMP (natural resistance-associated macrophage protein)-like metal ion transporter